jgi:hypothetical protein
MNFKTLIQSILAGTTLALLGCGGGGGGETTTPPVAGTTISGVATKGPVNGANVTVFAVKSDGTIDRSANFGTAITAADGKYTITLSSAPTGPVVVEVTPTATSTYADEVSTAAPVPFKATLRAVTPSVTSGAASTIMITPLTEMAAAQTQGKSGGFTAANITAANKGVADFFKVDDIITRIPSATGIADQKNYAAALNTISQLITDKKGATEALADALIRVMNDLDKEMAAGGLTGDTIVAFANAGTSFQTTNPNAPPPAITKPAGGTLRLSTTGTLPAGILIGGIDVTVELPAGVTVKTQTAFPQEPDAGVVTISGEAAKAGGATISGTRFVPASGATPATIKFIIGSVNPAAGALTGFLTGEFVSIKCDVATTASFPTVAAFKILSISVLDGTNAANSLNSTVQGATAFNAIFQ